MTDPGARDGADIHALCADAKQSRDQRQGTLVDDDIHSGDNAVEEVVGLGLSLGARIAGSLAHERHVGAGRRSRMCDDVELAVRRDEKSQQRERLLLRQVAEQSRNEPLAL